MSAKRPPAIPAAVEELFGKEAVARDLALQLLNSWLANLQSTEVRIRRQFTAIVGVFTAFLALDTGVLAKLAFQGAELHRTGLVLCMVPITMAYLYYRCITQVSFIHDLRTAIAVLYRKLYEPVYHGGLDLLTHVPTVRNLEMYDTFRAPSGMAALHKWTTNAVSLSALLGPVVAMLYCIIRLWDYADVGPVVWIVTIVLSAVFVVRAWLFGAEIDRDEQFALRRRSSPSNQPLQATDGEDEPSARS